MVDSGGSEKEIVTTEMGERWGWGREGGSKAMRCISLREGSQTQRIWHTQKPNEKSSVWLRYKVEGRMGQDMSY